MAMEVCDTLGSWHCCWGPGIRQSDQGGRREEGSHARQGKVGQGVQSKCLMERVPVVDPPQKCPWQSGVSPQGSTKGCSKPCSFSFTPEIMRIKARPLYMLGKRHTPNTS